jgi:hypothetical protein
MELIFFGRLILILVLLVIKLKKIITVQIFLFCATENFSVGEKIFGILALAVKKKLKLADRIIAFSENTKNDLIELLGISEEK